MLYSYTCHWVLLGYNNNNIKNINIHKLKLDLKLEQSELVYYMLEDVSGFSARTLFYCKFNFKA